MSLKAKEKTRNRLVSVWQNRNPQEGACLLMFQKFDFRIFAITGFNMFFSGLLFVSFLKSNPLNHAVVHEAGLNLLRAKLHFPCVSNFNKSQSVNEYSVDKIMGDPKTLTPGPRTPTTGRVRGLPTDRSTDYPY